MQLFSYVRWLDYPKANSRYNLSFILERIINKPGIDGFLRCIKLKEQLYKCGGLSGCDKREC